MKEEKPKSENFSILKEIWFPLIFIFILGVMTFGGYLLLGGEKETSSPKSEKQKEVSEQALQFLDLLKKGAREEAFDQTSKEFRLAMPYPRFNQFISDYPILTEFEKVESKPSLYEDDMAMVPLILSGQNNVLPIHFTLREEEGDWKIVGFVINQASQNQDLRDLDAVNELTKVITGFLLDLRQGDIEKAYKNYTTEDFQKETPKERFIAYINERPVFRLQAGGDAIDGHQDGSRGYLKMFLNVDGERIPIDFGLRHSSDGWKIEGMYLLLAPTLKTLPDQKRGTVHILDGFVGISLDDKGVIQEPLKEISSGIKTVHFSIVLETSRPYLPLKIALVHLPTEAETFPILTKIPKLGLTRLSFSFRAPPGGWPSGRYAFRATSGDVKKDFTFRIND